MTARIRRTPRHTHLRRLAGRPAAVLLVAALAVGGCSSSKDEDKAGATGSPVPGRVAPSATVHAPDECTTVAEGDSPEELAVAVSSALFEASPVVVVAPSTEGTELRAGAEQAQRLGAPLLVSSAAGGETVSIDNDTGADSGTPSTAAREDCDDETPAPSASPSASASPSEEPVDEPTDEPSDEPTDEPGETTSPEPTFTAASVADPSASPEPSELSESSESPEPIASPEPSELPEAAEASSCTLPVFELPEPPTATPAATPSATGSPSASPSATGEPTDEPSEDPSELPSDDPSESPTDEPTDEPSATATATSTPTPVAAADRPLVREIQRLKPEAVLAMSPEVAADLAAAVPGLKVVTDANDLPRTSMPTALGGVAVLVDADDAKDDDTSDSRIGAIAAAATAQAAGAKAIAVVGDDPRADACAIEAIAEGRPTHVLAAGDDFGSGSRLENRLEVVRTGVQLPGGGQVMFPGRRLIALYGHPGAPELGAMGHQGLSAAIERARTVASPYRSLSDVPVVPTFEIITTVAQGSAGGDGDYSAESDIDKIREWVEAAGEAGMYVVLDIQPGRSEVLSQAKMYSDLLKLPHVGLAIDPEWKLKPGQVPLRQIGSIDASEINRTIDWLADLTEENDLPQKLVVLHQFSLHMITNRDDVDTSHDSLSVLVHMDGQGEPSAKDGTWRIVTQNMPDDIWLGWKNFYKKDTRTLSAAETMTKKPTPVMISYQ